MTSDHESLRAILKERSLRLGDFTLASGKKSTYYVDARPTAMSARGIDLIGRLGMRAIQEAGWEPDSVGGLTLGADPIAYAIALASLSTERVLDGFTVRKEAKEYGAKKRIEGCFENGHRVVVVEDVITTGGSALTAAQAVEEAGGTVVGILAVVDREEGGREKIEAAGYPVTTLVPVSMLGVTPNPLD